MSQRHLILRHDELYSVASDIILTVLLLSVKEDQIETRVKYETAMTCQHEDDNGSSVSREGCEKILGVWCTLFR
jgi:hypothetical protein